MTYILGAFTTAAINYNSRADPLRARGGCGVEQTTGWERATTRSHTVMLAITAAMICRRLCVRDER